MEFSDYYNDYFLWNDALWKYYFEGENTSEQVLLYADDNIIRNIGSNCSAIKDRFEELEGHDDYLDFFYESILFNNIEDIKHFFYLKGSLRGIQQRSITEEFLSEARISSVLQAYGRQTIQTTAIIDFARALASITNQEFGHKCPCLCYVVFLILEYNRSRTYEGIITKLREKSGLANASILPEQFMELFRSVEEWSKCDTIPGFSADRIRGEQQLVGVLKYHLVLNRSEMIELQDALYEYNIDWDESGISYRDLVNNYILPIITRGDIINALKKSENYIFFYSLFHEFNLDNYTPSRLLPKKQRGHFFLLFDREEKEFLLKADVKANDDKAYNDHVIISCNGEKECGLYRANYLCGEMGLDVYQNLCYENEHIKVTSIKRDWLFFLLEGKYFKQVLNPVENEGCLIITHKSLDEVSEALNQGSLLDYSQPLSTIFGEGNNVFFVKSWSQNEILKDNIESDELDNGPLLSSPKLTNGILNPAFKRCYLPEGLPIIQCAQEISVDDVEIYDDTDHTIRELYIDKELIPGKNIVRLSLNKVINKYQEFYIVVSGEDLGVIRVKGSNTINGDNTIWYDSWGCATVTKDECSVLCDNTIEYENPGISNIDNNQLYSKENRKSLVPLLKSYAYARKETNRPYLLDRDVSKIINYVSLVEHWGIDKDELAYVKYNLINFGILSMATDNCGERRFEVNNPRLVPVGSNKYLLYGAYTFPQFEEVKHSQDIVHSQTIEDVQGIHSDLLIVQLKNGDHESISGIPVMKQSLVKILLEKSTKMDIRKFKEEFLNTPEEAKDHKQRGCTFRKPSKSQFFSSIQEDGILFARYKRRDNTFQQIPTSLQKLYVCRVNSKPLMMWDEDTFTISFDSNMGIPYYIERVLCLLSKNVGVREKAFGMGYCIERKLFSTIKSFQLSDPKYKDYIFSILSNNEIAATNGILPYREYKGYISLFYKINEKDNKTGLYHEFVLLNNNKVELVVRYDYGIVSAFGYHDGYIKEVACEDVNTIITDYINGMPLKWGDSIKNESFLGIEYIIANYQRLKIIKKVS